MSDAIKSFVFHDGDNVSRDYTFDFPYISRNHVRVYIDDEPYGDFQWMGSHSIQFNTAPSTGTKIKIARETPREVALVTIADGSALRAKDLNVANLQALFIAQEADDTAVYVSTSTIIAPLSDAGRVDLVIPSIEDRRNKIMGFDNEGRFMIYTEDNMPSGPRGPEGDKGPTGNQGPVGVQGPQGSTGPTGVRGPEGPQGPEGIRGPQGLQGIVGPSFEPDNFGRTADMASFDSAPQGFAFLDLDLGQIFFKLSNATGDWSEGVAFGQGLQGVQGPQGVTGERGALGPVGETGPVGPQGVQGVIGPVGEQGEQGVPGRAWGVWRGLWSSTNIYDAGDVVHYDGRAYVRSVSTGTNIGTPTNATYWGLVADRGVQGAAGTPGATGPTGPTGPQGSTGSPGPQGSLGPRGLDGPAGARGAQGPQGPQGPAGAAIVYTGTSASETNFPVGHTVLATSTTAITPNATVYVGFGSSGYGILGSASGALVGTWRCRGSVFTSGGQIVVQVQRAA